MVATGAPSELSRKRHGIGSRRGAHRSHEQEEWASSRSIRNTRVGVWGGRVEDNAGVLDRYGAEASATRLIVRSGIAQFVGEVSSALISHGIALIDGCVPEQTQRNGLQCLDLEIVNAHPHDGWLASGSAKDLCYCLIRPRVAGVSLRCDVDTVPSALEDEALNGRSALFGVRLTNGHDRPLRAECRIHLAPAIGRAKVALGKEDDNDPRV
eukprot:scaffold240530_cov30-Tisochrysis_lutea.AAC.8